MKHVIPLIFCYVLLLAPASVFAQFKYIWPLPGSKFHNKETSIILKNGSFIDPSSIKNNLVTITGTRSGLHSARVVLSDDKKTLVIYPQPMLQNGENITVNVANGFKKSDGTLINGTSFEFETRPDRNVPKSPDNNQGSEAGTRELCGIAPFSLTSTSGAYPGNAFYYNFWTYAPACWARTVISNTGDSVYAGFDDNQGIDFKINHNGYITYHDAITRLWYMADSSFNVVKTFQMGNGYFSDEHDFQIFPNGYYLMMGLDTMFDQDLTSIGGNDSINVIGNVVQELDPSGNVIFEWNSFIPGQYSYSDAMFWVLSPVPFLPQHGSWDWFHANSFELYQDSTILLSSRHYSEVTKLSLTTGNILWRWGGTNNQFHFFNDDSDRYYHPGSADTFFFSGQHDVRCLPNGHITMFNNDNRLDLAGGITKVWSDAKEYVLDETNKTATLVWHYYNPPVNGLDLQANAMGSVQRLPNGNTFISWGLIVQSYNLMPKITEVDSLGNKVWELSWTDTVNFFAAYRAHKYIWEPCNILPDSSLHTDSITTHSAGLSWASNSKFSGYILEYKLCGASTWIQVPLDTNYFKLDGLLPDSCYNWRVRNICAIYNDTALSSTHQFTTLNSLGIPQPINSIASFKLYPNPTSGEVEINFTISAEQQVGFTIYNFLGGIVKHEIISAHAGTNKMKVDLGNLAAGVYNVELKAGTQIMYNRLVVH